MWLNDLINNFFDWFMKRKYGIDKPKDVVDIGYREVVELLQTQLPNTEQDVTVMVSDHKYKLAPKSEYIRMIRYDNTNTMMYEKDYLDCIAGNEEIITKDGFKTVKDIKTGDTVLSYDWGKKAFCYKKIINKMDKGLLPIKRVHLKNHEFIDITEKHPMWHRIKGKGEVGYKKEYLNNINLNTWYERQVPTAKKIPYKVKDIEWLNEDLCFVLGHFLAEGWTQKTSVYTSGRECFLIGQILQRNNIPYTQSRNNSNVPYIYFKASPFSKFLSQFLTNSFDVHLTDEILSLPENKLCKILMGEFIGDGGTHNTNYVVSTSSYQFAKDLRMLSLRIGFPFYIYKQEHHGGVGTQPIYRLYHNPSGIENTGYGYDGLSETTIKYIEDKPSRQVYDFTVEDTSTFFFKNGLCCHQCDDFATRLHGAFCIPGWSALVVGEVICNTGTDCHAINCFIDSDKKVWLVEPQSDFIWSASERDWQYFSVELS